MGRVEAHDRARAENQQNGKSTILENKEADHAKNAIFQKASAAYKLTEREDDAIFET